MLNEQFVTKFSHVALVFVSAYSNIASATKCIDTGHICIMVMLLFQY